jgi:hypothetical protein
VSFDQSLNPESDSAINIPEGSMRKNAIMLVPFAFVVQTVSAGAPWPAPAQSEKAVYAAMAPLNQYLMADEQSEIALARSAAPPSISDEAEVMVLRREGYATAVKGSNGFLCIVERSWGAATDDPGFWNPGVRGPICFNPPAARTVVPIFLMKTQMVLAGESKRAIVQATASALDSGKLPALESGDVLHAVEAAVLRRPRQELASASDVFRSGQRREKLGRESAGLAHHRGG